MKSKPVQLAHIYRGQIFLGYGIAVDDMLLGQQLGATVNTETASMPSITAVFGLDAVMNENPIRIDVNDNGSHLHDVK
ncbi:hypothetical protein Q0Q01_30225 [Escherichia coli O8:H10]